MLFYVNSYSKCVSFYYYRKHPHKCEEMERLQQEFCKRPRLSSDDETGSAREQPGTMATFLTRQTVSAAVSQAKLYKLTLRFVVQGLHPLSIVERPEFKDYLQELVPRRQLLSRKTLVRMVEDEFVHMCTNLCTTLSQQDYVATTTDAWSTNNISFLGVTVRWIDQDTLQIQSGALACRRIIGRHTFHVLAGMLEDIHKDFKIEHNHR